jgi:uncharacterized protein (DUF2236 family)
MWVHATLVHTSLLVYTRYVGRLSLPEQRTYYQEQKVLAEQVGVPRDRQPETLDDFNDYFQDVVSSDRIAATAALRDVVDATLRPELPFVARPLIEALNLATTGLLPERLRDELGLPWGPKRRRVFRASRAVLSALLPVLPRIMREFPPARSADRRVSSLPRAA